MKDKNSYGIASLVLGILSIIFSIIPIIGVVCGIVGIICAIKQRKIYPNGISTAGLITGIIGLIISALIISAVVFIFSYIFLFSLGTLYSLQSSDDPFSSEFCPENMVIDKYYGEFFTSANDYNNKHNYTAKDYIESFEKDKEDYGTYLISAHHNAWKQGIEIDIENKCVNSNSAGANINHVYCGNNANQRIVYLSPTMIDGAGIIQPRESYEIMWIIDKRTCVFREPIIGEEYGGWVSGINFECDFVEVGCRKV